MQDLFDSPLMNMAQYRYCPRRLSPNGIGSYVNHADRLQSFKMGGVRAGGRSKRSKGRLFWQLVRMSGLYNCTRKVLDEVAGEIGYFHVAGQPVPDVGVDLKVNQLAGV